MFCLISFVRIKFMNESVIFPCSRYCKLIRSLSKNLHLTRNKFETSIRPKPNVACTQVPRFSVSANYRYSKKAVDLAYTSFNGSSNLAPILILHGLLGSKLNWKSLAKSICKKTERQVVTIDARNHGDSPHDDAIDYESMSEDVQKFISSHNFPEVVLVGHSMGGKTAMLTALTKPDMVQSLVVVDMSPANVTVEDPSSTTVGKLLSAMASVLPSIPLGATITEARRTCDVLLAKDISDTSLRHFVLTNLVQDEGGKTRWKVNVDALGQNYSTVLNYALPAKQFHKPTIFICGGNSNYVSVTNNDVVYEHFPKAEIVHVEGAGHWVHADKPEEFLAILTRFLQDKK